MKDAIDAVGNAGPALAVCLFALPAYIGVLRQRGFLGGLILLVALGLFALGFDTLVIKTGLYGDFSYDDSLGAKLLGTTPWTVGLIYPVMLLTAFWMASKLIKNGGRVILTALFMAALGVVLNPALIRLGIWQTETAGQFYGVPVVNFAGLLISGLVGGWILLRLWGKEREVRASIAYSGLAVILFWTGVNVGVEQWVPVGAGVFASLVVLLVLIIEKRQLRREHA